MLPQGNLVFMPEKINEAVATQAVYSTQVSLLQLCMCVIARIEFQGTLCPLPTKETLHMCKYASVPYI